MTVSIAVVRSIVEELQRRGVPDAEALRRGGIVAGRFDSPADRIPIADFGLFAEAAKASAADADLALVAGIRTPEYFHPLGHGMLASTTIREAIELLPRYSSLLAEQLAIEVDYPARSARLTFRVATETAGTARRMIAEFAAGVTHAILRRMTNGPQRQSLLLDRDLAHPRGVLVGFEGVLRGGNANLALEIPASELDAPRAHADAIFAALLRSRLDTMISATKVGTRLPTRIRDMILTAESPHELGVRNIAGSLGVGARTLRRHLGYTGGLRALVAATKRELAERLLLDPHMSIKEISYRLGYSEPSAFHRAFKRWTKLTPVEFRGTETTEPMHRRTVRAADLESAPEPDDDDEVDPGDGLIARAGAFG